MTKINWADMTWNPVLGCTRVSEGCRNCYAEQAAAGVNAKLGARSPYVGLVQRVSARQMQVNLATGEPTGKMRDRMRARWTGAVAFDPVVLAAPLKRRKPTTYFVNSMSDLFHNGFTNEQIAAVFGVMAACPQHTFILLTKRAQRMREVLETDQRAAWSDAIARHHLGGEDPDIMCDQIRFGARDLPNVILGVSVENQATADERIPHLLATPAAVRAISAEPLLGPVDVAKYMWPMHWSWDSRYTTPQEALAAGARAEKRRQALVLAPAAFLDWVVTGCESGPYARPCEVAWLRSLRDQCAEAQVPFWLKQAKADVFRRTADFPRDTPIQHSMGLCPTISEGPGSTLKPGGIIDLPYLDGVQWAQRPEVRR